MQLRLFDDWYKVLWKIVTHPTFKVAAALLAVAFSAWIVVQTQIDLQHDRVAVPVFGHK